MTRIHTLALGFLCLHPCLTGAIVDKWTPEGFDWDAPFVNETVSSGLTMKAQGAPSTTDLTNVALQTGEDGVAVVPVAAFLGFAWRVANIAVAGVALKNTVKTCKQTANEEASVYDCLEGVVTTAIAFGGAASAAKQIGSQARGVLFPHRLQNGIAEIVRQPLDTPY